MRVYLSALAASLLLSGCGGKEPEPLTCDKPEVQAQVLDAVQQQLQVLLLQLALAETDHPMPEAVINLDPHASKDQAQAFAIAKDAGVPKVATQQAKAWLDGLALTHVQPERADDVIDLVRCRAQIEGLPTGTQPIGYSAQRDVDEGSIDVGLIGL